MTFSFIESARLGGAAIMLWWAGAALRRAVEPAVGPLRTTVASDAAIGMTLCAFVGSILLVADLPLHPLSVVVVASLLTGLAWRRRSVSPVGTRPRPDWLVVTALVVAAVGIVCALVVARRDHLWWDGWAIWALKARVLFLEGTLPVEVLASPGPYDHAHPRYPVGVPLVTWWFHRHLGAVAPATASFVGALWFAVLVGLVWEALRDVTDRRFAALATAVVAWCDPVVSHAVGGTAEVVVAVALVGVVHAVGTRDLDRVAAWRCGVFLLLGVLAKQEGLALVAVTVVALASTGAFLRRWEWQLAISLPVCMWLGWQWHVSAFAPAEPLLSGALTGGLLVDRFAALMTTIGIVLVEGRWWPVAALAGVALVRARGRVRLGGRIVVGYVATLLLVYLLTPQDQVWLLRTSFVRVLSAVLPATVVLAAASLHALPPRIGLGLIDHRS